MRLEENKVLAPYTTLGVGGPARWFAEATTEEEVAESSDWARKNGIRLFVLGGGSNLLVSDAGFDGLVLQVALKGIHVREGIQGATERIYEVSAGEDWDHFVDRAISDHCAGIECLAGIPGTVGGTPVQNVGAYGQEVASVIDSVRVFDLEERAFMDFNSAECGFAYRRSRFNTRDRGRFVVTRVDYRLKSGGEPEIKYADLQRELDATVGDQKPGLKDVAVAVRRVRRSKGMLLVEGDPDCRSAGSFFKNPIVSADQLASVGLVAGAEPPRFPAGPDHDGYVKLPAAWLIEKAGFSKGLAMGRAGISQKHTLALVNRGDATAVEIIGLAEKIRDAVAVRFGIDLEMEPVMLGFDSATL
jgi:UDP-N-acetylmuramate dehydrogenase